MTILEGLDTKIHLTHRTSTTATVITSLASPNTTIYIHQESTAMPQNINNVQYALMPAGGAHEPPPAGQTYHLPGNSLVGEYSARRMNHRKISDHMLTLGVPPHAKGHPPAEYLTWRDAVKDQMLARGYITDNSQFPDAEFQQIVGGIRRLKPACDELATVSAVNNMPSMQAIDEAVLQLVKASGKKLAHTIKTTKKVPPGPGVPPGQVIVNPVLLRLNAPAQCQWSIATGVLNGGPVVLNGPGLAQNAPAAPANPQAQNNSPLPAIPQAQLIPHPPAHIPAQIQQAVPLFIPGIRLLVQHALANPQGQNNPPPPAIPKLSSFLTIRRIFLGKSNRQFHCLFLVRRCGSNMLRRFHKPEPIPAPHIANRRTILHFRRIILCKSNRLSQFLFLVRRWGSNMVRQCPKPRTIPAQRISNRRTILNWQRIILRKSNRLSQCLSLVPRCGSKMLPRRIFKPMMWHGEYRSPRPIRPQFVSFRNNPDVFVITY